MSCLHYKSPIGIIKIVGTIKGIESVSFVDHYEEDSKSIPDCLKNCVIQLDEYFLKKRKQFNLELNLKGTQFQTKVWKSLLNIPYGQTSTYLKQSITLNNREAIRAIASANGKNPILIILPCHRVIGSNGSLTGYSGELWRKKWLLEHESNIKQQKLF